MTFYNILKWSAWHRSLRFVKNAENLALYSNNMLNFQKNISLFGSLMDDVRSWINKNIFAKCFSPKTLGKYRKYDKSYNFHLILCNVCIHSFKQFHFFSNRVYFVRNALFSFGAICGIITAIYSFTIKHVRI